MKFLRLWSPVFLWAGLIFYLSSIPSLNTGWGVWDFILRKIAHISEYFILTLFLFRAFKGTFKLSYKLLIVWSSVLSFLYVLSDEYHQTFVPTRSGNLEDVLIDTLGIIAFYILLNVKTKSSEL